MVGPLLPALTHVCAIALTLGLSSPIQEPAAPAQPQPSQAQPAQGAAPAAQGGAAVSAQELANQVNNPAAPVTAFQMRDVFLPNVPGAEGAVNTLQIQPVLPITPFRWFPFTQLMKVTVPVAVKLPGFAVPGSCSTCGTTFAGATGVGDMQVFDLISIKESWGRWGLGPALSFPTASDKALGSGKWEAGPAFALMFTGVPNLTVGAIFQNPISYAGPADRSKVNQLIITPTFTMNLHEGWFVGMSDFNWSFDWENDGAATIPVGVQVGKIVRLGKQPVSVSFEAGGAAARPSGLENPGWILGFEVTPIFSFHLGPNQKVKVRGK